MSLPEPAELGLMRSVAISPDGTQLACVGGRFPATRIYYRRVEDLVLFTVFAKLPGPRPGRPPPLLDEGAAP